MDHSDTTGTLRASPCLRILFWVSLVAVLLHAWWHLEMILSPLPHEYREASQLTTTRLLLEGQHPYSEDQLPRNLQVYGIVYNYATAPLSALFGTTFLTHRIISGACLILCCILSASFVDGTRTFKALAALWTYLMLIPGYTILARPDALGLLLALLAFRLIQRKDFKPSAYAVTLPLGLLAGMAKPYFFLVIPVIASYTFFYRKKSLGLIYSVGFFASLAALYASINMVWPYYWRTTIGIHGNFGVQTWPWLVGQLIDFGRLHFIFITITIFFCASWKPARGAFKGDFLHLGKPLFQNRMRFQSYNLLVWALAACWLARNHGAYLIYLQQMISPWLAVFVAQYLATNRRTAFPWAELGLSANVIYLISTLPPFPSASNYQANRDLNSILSNYSPAIVPPLLLHHVDKSEAFDYFDNGQSEFFYYVYGNADEPAESPENALLQAYLEEWNNSVYSQRYSAIFAQPRMDFQGQLAETFEGYYYMKGTFSVPLYFARWDKRNLWGHGLANVSIYVPVGEDQTPK